MKTKRKTNNKVLISVFVFIVVTLSAVAGVITVLALSSRAINSSISIRFTAVDIEGEVEATYKIGDNGAITSISGNTPYEFKASDGTKNGAFSNVDLSLTSADSYVEFCYIFRNFGHVDYTGILTLDEVDQSNNMTITYKYNDKEYSSASYGLVVEGIDSADASKIKTRNGKQYTEMTYYIKVAVTDLGKSAEYTSDFFWLLEKYEAVPGEEVIPLATSTFTANGDGTFSAAYNGTSNAGTSSVGIQSTPSNVWVVPNRFGSARVTKVKKGKDFPANTKVVLGDNVTTIEEGLFSEDYVGSEVFVEIVFGKGITSISDVMFYNCYNLRSVTIGPNVTSIGEYAFFMCSGLTSITIPDSVTSIGSHAFQDCYGLTSITIPDSVTSIGYDAFYDCSGLTSVTIGSGVTSIGNNSFDGCTAVETLNYNANVTTAFSSGSYVFRNIGNNATKTVVNINSTTIPDYLFYYYCSAIDEVNIRKATSIGRSAFYYCTGLTSITIGNSVTSIGDSAFYGCTGLTSITIGSGVTSIGPAAFGNCLLLKEVVIPSTVEVLGDSAFIACTNLERATINAEKIVGYIFESCINLKNVVLGENVKEIGYGILFDCNNVVSVTFENPNGWMAGTTEILSTDLANTTTAADYLTSTYCECEWKRG